jgi:hypothetical protein
MIRFLRNYFTRKAERKAAERAEAERIARIKAERALAIAKHQAALRRASTRRQHETFKAAREATNRALGAGA